MHNSGERKDYEQSMQESFDEFAENNIDNLDGPSVEDLLAAEVTTVSIHDIVEQVNAEWRDRKSELHTTPVADTHPGGHMFNRVNGVMFCACDCELCSAPAPLGKHYPQCICPDCECDG